MADKKDFDIEKYYKNLNRAFKGGNPSFRQRVASKITPPGQSASPIGTARAFLKSTTNLYSSQMASYGMYCIDGNTEIYTPTGAITIKKLAEKYPNGEEFPVFSYDLEKKKIVCATAKNARYTKTDKTLKLTFDDGSELVCTYDHRILMRDGIYKEAQNIKLNESVMPLYKKDIFNTGYNFLISAGRTGIPEHRLVCEWKEKRGQKENEVVHHINRVKKDNRPENLMFMDKHEHYSMHSREAKSQWLDPVKTEQTKKKLKQSWAENYEERCEIIRNSRTEETCKKLSESTTKFNETYWTDENKEKHSKILSKVYSNPVALGNLSQAIAKSIKENKIEVSDNFSNYWKGKKRSEEWKKKASERKYRFRDDLTFDRIANVAKSNNFIKSKTLKELDCASRTLSKKILEFGFNYWFDFCEHVKQYNNHKVVAIESASAACQVYDLEVPAYNNFAIAYHGNPAIFIHNSRLARYSDYSEMESFSVISSAMDLYCLAGDTTIPLLNGEKITIKELFEQQKQDFWVYSYDIENNKYVPGLCKKAMKTGINQPVFKVFFDDGGFVKLTEKHLVLLKNGEYKRVKDLQFGDSIRSVYTKLSIPTKKQKWAKDYEMILQDSGEWKPTHRIVAEHFEPNGKGIVHHKDFRKWNNEPTNLQFMSFEDHKELHAKSNTERWANNEKHREKIIKIFSEHAKRMWADKDWVAWKKQYHSDFLIKMYQEHPEMKELVRHPGEDNGRYVHDISNDDILKAGEQYDEFQIFAENFNFKGKIFKHKLGKVQFLRRRLFECGYNGWRDYKENYISNNNHKVVSVEFFGDEDVYDLKVEKYHNFAIGNNVENSYVVVHNSDEICTKDEHGEMIKIFSHDSKLRNILQSFFYDVLNIDFNLWTWVRNFLKYGDQFLLVDHHPNHGVLQLLPMPVNEVEREEGFDQNDPLAYRYRWTTQGNRTLDPWQVIHFRNGGNDAFMPYGSSIIEAVRRSWRQVVLLEDAVMTYRIVRCGSGDSNVWTENGYKKLKDIKVNDKVYSYDIANKKLLLSTVTNAINNGRQQLWFVKSKHRTFKGNFNHPILVKNKETNEISYVLMTELVAKKYQLVAPKIEDDGIKIPISLKNENYEWFAHLSPAGYDYFKKNKFRRSKRSVIKELSEECSYNFKRIYFFLYPKLKGKFIVKAIPYDIALKVCNKFNIPINFLVKHPKGMYNLNRLNIPDYVDEEFAKFFGFMTGDGFLPKTKHAVGFASGNDLDINEYYSNIMKKYCTHVKFCEDKRSVFGVGKFYINSFYFSHLMFDMGMTTSVYTKRIPNWIYLSSEKIKKAFIDGLMDADGYYGKKGSMHITLCNKPLVEDLKELCHQLGYTVSSKVYGRTRKARKIRKFNVGETNCYYLYVTKKQTELFEDILEIGPTNEHEEVYDITVDNKFNNFIADGIVVHNSPERRVFYIDVGGIDPNDVPQFIEKVKGQLKRNQTVDASNGNLDKRYNPLSILDDYYIPVRGDMTSTRVESLPGGQYVGDIDDLQYHLCFRKGTEVKLLDGTFDTIENIINRIQNNENIWTYSINPESLCVEPTKILAGQNTGNRNDFVRINLDNGKFIDVTQDHLMILSNGKYIQAKDLNPGDSLAALYTKISSKENKNYLHGYEMLFNTGKQRWDYTHRLVAKYCLKNNLTKTNVVHHTSFNKLNNHPDFLYVCENSQEHRKIHAEINKSKELFKGDKNPNYCKDANIETLLGVARLSSNMKELMNKTKYRSFVIKRLIKSIGLTYREFHKKYMIKNPAVFYSCGYNLTIEDVKEAIRMPEVKSEIHVSKLLGCSTQTIGVIVCSAGYKKFNDLFWEIKNITFQNIVDCAKNCKTLKEISEKLSCSSTKIRNMIIANGFHSIKDFRKNKYFAGMYRTPQMFEKGTRSYNKCIGLNHKVVSIEFLNVSEDAYDIQVENNNNFALNSGIFVHNSKIFAGLKIPKSYLGYESEVNARSSLTQEDINFARTIARLQNVIVAELNKIAIIQLYSAGYRGEELMNFDISMASPSIITEIQRLELWRTRFEVASVATSAGEGVVDRSFTYKKLFKMSDEEIEQIEEGKRKDKLFDLEIEGMQSEMPPGEEVPSPGEGQEEIPPEGGPVSPGQAPVAAEPTLGTTSEPGEKPITTAGRDPNQQRIMPNSVRGPGKAGKKKFSKGLPGNLTQVFNFKKTALDPKDGLIQNTRVATTPFGESISMESILTEGADIVEERLSKQQLQSRIIQHEHLLKQLDKESVRWDAIKTSPPPIGSEVIPIEDESEENKDKE